MNLNINKKGFFVVVAVLISVVFAGMMYNDSHKAPSEKISDSVSDVIKSADEGIAEFREEVKDEIDDNTDSK